MNTLKSSLFTGMFVLTIFCFSCEEQKSAPSMNSIQELREMVFTTNLKDDSTAIAQYKYLHSKEGIWPEIREANETAGVESVKIYLQGRRLFMVVAVPADADMAQVDSLYAASNPEKLKAWAELTGTFQEAPPGADSGQVWVPMELIYDYQQNQDR